MTVSTSRATPDDPARPGEEPAAPPPIAGRARTIALICLLAASFMELMDATVVNVALRTIADDLGASATALQWFAAGYPLAYAVGLVLGARLGDRCGRRRMFVIGLAVFGLASLACGLAASPVQLVIFRVLQGGAAALMVPQVLTSIQVMYPAQERGRAMGMFTSVMGLAAVAGPVVGALVTQGDWFGLGWRPVFLINVPIAVVAVVAALAFIPETRAERPAPISLGSTALLGSALAAIMVPITLGQENGWPVWGFAVMACGLAAIGVFAQRQLAAQRRGVVPMIPPAVFATRSFSTGLLAFAALFVPMGGFFLVQSLHVQLAHHWTVLHTGLMWIPFSIAVPVSAGLAATVLALRFGRRVLQGGAVVLAAGFALMAYADGSSHPALWFTVALVIAGLGFGFVVGAAGLLVLNDVPVEQAGAASGIFNTVQALSVALGTAVIGTVYNASAAPDGLSGGSRAAAWTMIALVMLGGFLAQAMPRRVGERGEPGDQAEV